MTNLKIAAVTSILARNMGSDADQMTQFPPSIVNPEGHVLIHSTYERNVSVMKFSDIKTVIKRWYKLERHAVHCSI
jgi:hypothetical protein